MAENPIACCGAESHSLSTWHIHIFVDCPQTVAPCDVVRTLKSISTIELFKAYPQLKQFYAKCGKLWFDGYFISTLEHISEATVKKYIKEQTNED